MLAASAAAGMQRGIHLSVPKVLEGFGTSDWKHGLIPTGYSISTGGGGGVGGAGGGGGERGEGGGVAGGGDGGAYRCHLVPCLNLKRPQQEMCQSRDHSEHYLQFEGT